MDKESERKAFLEAIDADPYDQTTRLVFADWLEEFGEGPDDDLAVWQRSWTPERQGAEDRLHVFAERAGVTFAEAIQAGHYYVDTGDYFVQYDTEKACNLMNNKEIKESYWRDWEIYTGRKRSEPEWEDDTEPFSCSC